MIPLPLITLSRLVFLLPQIPMYFYIKIIIIKIFTVNNLQIYLDAMPFIGSKNVNLTTLNKKIPNSAKAVALLQVSNML